MPSSKDNAHVFIYKKSKTNDETFLYTKSQTFFKKLVNSRCDFEYKKRYIISDGIFHEMFELGIYLYKASNFGLRDVFIFKKLDTSQKPRQFCDTFL